MLTKLRLYREYRRQGLRRAWTLSGMTAISRQVAAWFFVGVAIVAGAVLLSSQAEAIHQAADNRVAAKLTKQQADVDALLRIVSACLGEREGSIWIGDELHLCRAVPIGVRR